MADIENEKIEEQADVQATEDQVEKAVEEKGVKPIGQQADGVDNDQPKEPDQSEEQADVQTEADPETTAEDVPKDDSEDVSKAKKPWSRKTKVLASVAVLACIAALITGVNLTLTAFSANSFMKSVAATNESPNLLSSDVLAGYTDQPKADDYPLKSTVVPITGETASFSFSIFNYLQNDPTVYCQKNITYKLKIEVTSGNGNATHSIKINNGGSVNFGTSWESSDNDLETLAGRTGSKNTYTVTLPKSEVNNAIFVITASVVDSGGTSVRYLVAKIAPSQEATIATSTATINPVQESSFENCAAYRYEVKVNGTSDMAVKLSWNPRLVEIDPYFPSRNNGAVDKEAGTASFTAKPGTMFINFYRVSDDKPTSWDDLEVKLI